MLNRTSTSTASFALCVMLGLAIANPAFAKPEIYQAEESRQIDVVIALDVSGSMSGLIASAKQRLWDIVNQMGHAHPGPRTSSGLHLPLRSTTSGVSVSCVSIGRSRSEKVRKRSSSMRIAPFMAPGGAGRHAT